jgi:hypothetical protein
MSDFGIQSREVWKQPNRLPAEGRLGSSENTSKPRRRLYCCLLGPLLIYATWLASGDKTLLLALPDSCGRDNRQQIIAMSCGKNNGQLKLQSYCEVRNRT